MEKFYYILEFEGDPTGPPFFTSLDEAKEAAGKRADELFREHGTKYQLVILSADTAVTKPVNPYTEFVKIS